MIRRDFPLRLILPFPTGGPTDIVARTFGQKLGEALGQQVVVDNRGGAAGVIACEIAARAVPDGYTLLLGVIGTMSVQPNLTAKLPYDPVRDFAPVSLLSESPYVFALSNTVNARSVKELVALAKASPGKLTFASSGNGGAVGAATTTTNNDFTIVNWTVQATYNVTAADVLAFGYSKTPGAKNCGNAFSTAAGVGNGIIGNNAGRGHGRGPATVGGHHPEGRLRGRFLRRLHERLVASLGRYARRDPTPHLPTQAIPLVPGARRGHAVEVLRPLPFRGRRPRRAAPHALASDPGARGLRLHAAEAASHAGRNRDRVER